MNVLKEIHRESLKNPESFQQKIADELFWYQKSGPVIEAMNQSPFGRWFPDWKISISHNALDRQISGPLKNKVAYYSEGENGETRTLTYYYLYREVNGLPPV